MTDLVSERIANSALSSRPLDALHWTSVSALHWTSVRHIIEFISVNGLNMVPEGMGDLARRHKDVTILFMDIVGGWPVLKH